MEISLANSAFMIMCMAFCISNDTWFGIILCGYGKKKECFEYDYVLLFLYVD